MRKEAVIDLWTVVVFLATIALSRAARADQAGSAGADAQSAPATRDSTDDGADYSDASSAAKALPAVTPLLPGSELKAKPLLDDAFEKRRLALEAHLGFGTPVGTLGFIAEYSVWPFLGIGAGAGAGFGALEGNALLGAVVARLRPIRSRQNALVFGGAYSVGGYHRFDPGLGEHTPDSVGTEWAHWAQADIGWERRSARGFLIRLSLGAAFLLNPSDLTCERYNATCSPPSSQTLVTFDLALGYAF